MMKQFVTVLLGSLLAAPLVATAGSESFCLRLNTINNGQYQVNAINDVAGYGQVLSYLAEEAPQDIQADLEALSELFIDWSQIGRESDGLLGFFKKLGNFGIFERLSDPQLAELEARIARGLHSHCGVGPAEPSYLVDPSVDERVVCPAWPRVGSILSNNKFPNYLDSSGTNYFANQLWAVPFLPAPKGFIKVPRDGRVQLQAEYPRSRYFAYHPNDMDLNNLPTLQDRDILPDPGSRNPFIDKKAPRSGQRYTVNYLFSEAPANPAVSTPYPNVRYLGVRKHGGYNPYAFNMLRLYASDIGDHPNSGGVLLPAVTVFDADGNQVQHFPACNPYPQGHTPFTNNTRFPILAIGDFEATLPASWDTSSNFRLSTDILANADVQYLNTTVSRRFGELALIRGKLPPTPDTRAGDSPATGRDELRLLTVCTYNMWAGEAVDCKLDSELITDVDDNYTLVITDTGHSPGKTTLERHRATLFDWGSYLDAQVTYRTVFRDNPIVKKVAAVLEGNTQIDAAIAPYVPEVRYCSKALFEQGGWSACGVLAD